MNIFQSSIKHYQKVKWFAKNYASINTFSQLKKYHDDHFLGPITYNTDSLTTSNNTDFINELKFAKAYAAAAATNPWPGFTLQWRVYIVCWFANFVKHLAGDFVECGVTTGAYSRAVIDYINFNALNKTFYLFDTFVGMPEAQVSNEEKKAGVGLYLGNHYKDVYTEVTKTFAGFNVRIIKGEVPYTLNECDADKICYLSIDMNCVAPEIAAAEYFWDKLVSGAVIILDDYGFPPHINQKLAFDDFARQKNLSILTLPTGQGIFFKP